MQQRGSEFGSLRIRIPTAGKKNKNRIRWIPKELFGGYDSREIVSSEARTRHFARESRVLPCLCSLTPLSNPPRSYRWNEQNVMNFVWWICQCLTHVDGVIELLGQRIFHSICLVNCVAVFSSMLVCSLHFDSRLLLERTEAEWNLLEIWTLRRLVW
jgi:hypothetical protein